MRAPLLAATLIAGSVLAQPRVLHFAKTSGFDHGTREASLAMFQSIAQDLGVTVDDDPTGAAFDDLGTLLEYRVIVFGNTSGDDLLSPQQRANFEQWAAKAGRVLGIHAASDTYRHSSANGGSTGAWDFYAELMGASVQESPNHVAGTPQHAMVHIGLHASTANLPDPWVKNEEYYYWEGGYYNPANVEVLRVEETVGPNGQVNSYDAPRPMSWYRELPGDARVFYTALGHAEENYTSDALFRTHIKDALGWLLDLGTAMTEAQVAGFVVWPNPTVEEVQVSGLQPGALLTIADRLGRTVSSFRQNGQMMRIDLGFLPNGLYTLRSEGIARPLVIAR